jgi:anti-sigma factor RsiW
MTCQDAEKLILLQDSGEMPTKRANELAAHLHDCEDCRQFQFALIESKPHFYALEEEPSATIMQNVLREARVNAPEKKRFRLPLFGMRQIIPAAAALVIALGLFFGMNSPDKVAMELVMTETQLMDTETQLASMVYEGFSDDDHAFNFLMTYEDSYASL